MFLDKQPRLNVNLRLVLNTELINKTQCFQERFVFSWHCSWRVHFIFVSS